MKDRATKVESDLTLFRKNLFAARAIKCYSVKELSNLAGLKSHKRVYDLEEGRCPPSLQEVISLSQVLQVSIDDLLFAESSLSFKR